MEKKKKYTGVIILNYNNDKDTINCIMSVDKYNTHPIKIIIVDNGSKKIYKDGLFASLKKTFKEEFIVYKDNETINGPLTYISLILSATNDGYAQGNNKGLKLAYQDNDINNVLILNNDILFIEDIIPTLVKDLYSTPNAAIISPLLYKRDLGDIDYNCARKAITLKQNFFLFGCLFMNVKSIYKKTHILYNKDISLAQNKLIEIDLPSGSCMIIDKLFFKSIGSFDPNTFLYYEEDILHAKTSGTKKKNYLDPNVKCIHLGASTTSTQTSSIFTLKQSCISNYYYLKKYKKANIFYLMIMKLFYAELLFKQRIKNHLNKLLN